MLLTELIDIVMCESGQFIVSGGVTGGNPLDCLGVSTELFHKGIVKPVCKLYERYRPLTLKFNRTALPTGNAEATVIFGSSADSTENFSTSKIFDPRIALANRDPGRPPKWISEVVPVNVLTVAGILYLIQETRFTNVAEQSILHEPRTFLWHYENPILYLTETGGMDITAHYSYIREEIFDSEGNLVDVDMEDVDEGVDRIFIDLVLAKFLQKVGRSRRTFRLNDLPIEYDAEAMVSEGIELEREARERMYDQSNWYDAIGT